MSVGSRIKEIRENKNLSRTDLAESLGVTVGAISNYENGISSPKEPILFRIMEVLKCDANYLFQDNMKTSAYSDVSTPEEFEKLIKRYRALDPPGQSHVDAVLTWETERMTQVKQDSKHIEKLTEIPHYVNAAHPIDGASEEDKQFDEDMMDEENF